MLALLWTEFSLLDLGFIYCQHCTSWEGKTVQFWAFLLIQIFQNKETFKDFVIFSILVSLFLFLLFHGIRGWPYHSFTIPAIAFYISYHIPLISYPAHPSYFKFPLQIFFDLVEILNPCLIHFSLLSNFLVTQLKVYIMYYKLYIM